MASLASINIRFNADLKEFSTQMQGVQKQLDKTGKKLQSVGATLTKGLTLPIAAFGALAISTFANFEQEMAKVKAISGATDAQFKALTDSAKKLGETTNFTASEVAGLQLSFSKLGFNPDEILKVTAATLDLALATGEDLANSATVAASTLRGFGLSVEETGRVTDVMAKSFSSSALDLQKFQVAMAVLAPVAKTAGVEIEQATGLLSTLVNAGVDASTAGTGLRNVFLDLADKGISMTDALDKIQNSTNKNKTAMELFGKRGATVANILADNVDAAKNFTTAYDNAGGSAKRMADIMNNTLSGSFAKLKSAFEGVLIGVGEQLGPVINKAATYITDLLGKLNELSPTTKKWLVILGGVAAALGPIIGLAGVVLPALLTGFALLTGPIALIVAGLTAIGVVIYKNWEPIKRTLRQLANYFIDLYNESVVFQAGVEGVIAHFKNLFEVGKFVFESLKNILGGFIDNFVNGFKSVGKIIKAVLAGDLSSIPDILQEATNDSVGVFGEFTGALADDWKNLTDGIKKNTEDALGNITSRKKLSLLKADVDATGVKEAVEEAASTGFKSGLGGGFADVGETIGSQLKGKGGLSFEDVLDVEKIKSDTAEATEGLEDLFASTGVKLAEAMEFSQGEAMFAGITNQYEDFLITTDDDLIIPFAEKLQRLQEIGESVGDAVGGAFENLSGRLVDSLGLASAGFEGFIKGLVGTITKLISMMLASSISQSIAGATASGTATGPLAIFTTPAFIATAVGGVLSAFAAIPKFATGGVVGGSSFHGDKILARVNSGELLLNSKQQERVHSAMNGGSNVGVSVSGEFKLQGDNLVAVVDRTMKKLSRQS